jgi:hypothetical protein
MASRACPNERVIRRSISQSRQQRDSQHLQDTMSVSESCKKVKTAIRQAKPRSQFVSVWADPRRSLWYVRSNPLTRFAGMFALMISSLLIGWLLGKSGSSNRTTMGFSTSVRNVAVSLVIATDSFPGTPAVTAALAYGIFQALALAIGGISLKTV